MGWMEIVQLREQWRMERHCSAPWRWGWVRTSTASEATHTTFLCDSTTPLPRGLPATICATFGSCSPSREFTGEELFSWLKRQSRLDALEPIIHLLDDSLELLEAV